jgi:hypothetical protein
MPCKTHQSALTEAATGAPISDELRSHLIVCADCRAALAQEEKLFAGIDAGLRIVANAEVPTSLIPSVRARLNEPSPRRRWFMPVLVPITAALILAFLVARSLHLRPEKPSTPSTEASAPRPRVPAPKPVAPPIEFAANSGLAAVTHVSRHPGLSRSPSDADSMPEVLVPHGDEAVLIAYAQEWGMQKHARLKAEVLPAPSLGPLEIMPIQIAPLDVKPLEEAGSR